MNPTLAEIVRFLNRAEVRATYGAVAGLLRVVPRSMGARLGDKEPQKSWIVNAKTGLPTGYTAAEMHRMLKRNPTIFKRLKNFCAN